MASTEVVAWLWSGRAGVLSHETALHSIVDRTANRLWIDDFEVR